jgi:hypothetical protein
MSQERPAEALKYFEQALKIDPNFAVARLNLGISLLEQQKLERALTALLEAVERIPKDPYAWYNLGLLYKDLGDTEKGIAAFQRVAEIAPNQADAYYFIGALNTRLHKYDQAIAAFEKGLALDHFHASSEFGLARAFELKGYSASAREHLARLQKITTKHLGTPYGAGYGDRGKYSFAEVPLSSVADPPAPIPVRFMAQANAFVSASDSDRSIAVGPSTGACFFDYDGNGKPDLFLVSGARDSSSHLLHNLGEGRFRDVTQEAGLSFMGSGFGCAAGDFDNDGKTDLAVCLSDGVRLLRNKGEGKFEDVTEAVGIRKDKKCVSVTFVDYDHDGNADLYLTMASDSSSPGGTPHNVLWRNNGNRTFTDVSAETGMGIAATGAGVVTTDFNNDRAVDLVTAGGQGGAAIYLNPREGKFTALAGIDFGREKLPPAVGVVALDFNKDGWMDLAFTHAGAPGISLWRNLEGKRLERVTVPDFGWQRGWGIAALDYDNDGWLDLAAVGESNGAGEIRLLRNLGSKGWADVTKEVHLDAVTLNQPRAIAVADINGNGNADLVVTQFGGAPVLLRNEGGNQHNWMTVELTVKSGAHGGIGTKVEVYAGTLYQKWEVTGASGYLGHSTTPILAGLGTEHNAEAVRWVWPTAVPQDTWVILLSPESRSGLQRVSPRTPISTPPTRKSH